jgi:hypothetical protein
MAVWKRRSAWLTVWLFSGLLVALLCLFLLSVGNATRTAYEQVAPGVHKDQVWSAFKRPADDRIPVVTFVPGPIPVNGQVEVWGNTDDGAHVLYDDEGVVISKERRSGPGWFRRTANRLGIPLPF